MRHQLSTFRHSAGLTLVELVAAMVIASIAAIGLGAGITSIVGFYQDDWVTKDARFWGYESIDYLVRKIETAKAVTVRQYLANYDGVLIAPKDGTRQLNIQANEYDGLTENGLPMLDYADFPSEGTYKSEGQRIVALEKFTISEIDDLEKYREEFRGKPYLTALKKSLYVIEMVISVTTKYQGESSVEYLRFDRVAWAKDKYFR
ncbi:MAG: prepilin-type N-terminal cleavage/methylation domain-containing protein [Candidatus Marinimicrobia bacterium]|nr:prepilin-type N-terminal cleavage/methylation domain-containing protein [Candidatus Neomarinimicrobiota bacterium]MCF7922726.1 prepilin-type N-terminal cleavage/methylation domain-containing protein [Candidatus Neomarinimicrobiota bacterium]